MTANHPTSCRFALLLLAFCIGCGHGADDAVHTPLQSFGDRQLEQMLEDRPDMREVISPRGALAQWLIEGFNGDRLGQRVYWNANTPQSGRSAEHASPYGTYPPYISISGGTETTAIDKWASLVFEMHNLENTSAFEKVATAATQGSMDADAFADECVKLEFSALLKTKEFFKANPLPKSKHGNDTWYNWVMSNELQYEDYKRQYSLPGMSVLDSNFEYFKEYYEKTIVPYKEAAGAK